MDMCRVTDRKVTDRKVTDIKAKLLTDIKGYRVTQNDWLTWRQNLIEAMKIPPWRHFHQQFAFMLATYLYLYPVQDDTQAANMKAKWWWKCLPEGIFITSIQFCVHVSCWLSVCLQWRHFHHALQFYRLNLTSRCLKCNFIIMLRLLQSFFYYL